MEEIILKGTVHHISYYVTKDKQSNMFGYIVIPDGLPNYLIKKIKKIKVPGGWSIDKYALEVRNELQEASNKMADSVHLLGFCPNSIEITLDILPFPETWKVNDVASECVSVLNEVNKIFCDIKTKIDAKFN